jgi:stage III sporulation protein AG
MTKIKGIGYILLAILAGIILLVLPTGSGEETAKEEPVYKSANEYCLALETKTEELIKELGVKSCKVQITLVYGYEYAYAADQRVNQTNDSTGSVATKEIEKKYVVITSSKGSETVLLREKMPTVQGIAVVCKGASYETQYKIVSLLTALFDIPSNKISVQN